LREFSSCSCLTALPGPAWVLLSKTFKPFRPTQYYYYCSFNHLIQLCQSNVSSLDSHNNVFPIMSEGSVACSRFLASSGRGGEFMQPLPPILWEKRYLDCLTKQPNFSVQVAKLQVEGSSFLDYCALIRDAFISPSMVSLTNIWQQTCSPLASSPSFPPTG